MNAKKIVVTGKIPQPGIDLLVEAGHDVLAWDQASPIERGELLRRVERRRWLQQP
jgi:hypothetical protein